MNNLICKLFGHNIINLDIKNRTGKCTRCGKKLSTWYNMSTGETMCDDK